MFWSRFSEIRRRQIIHLWKRKNSFALISPPLSLKWHRSEAREEEGLHPLLLGVECRWSRAHPPPPPPHPTFPEIEKGKIPVASDRKRRWGRRIEEEEESAPAKISRRRRRKEEEEESDFGLEHRSSYGFNRIFGGNLALPPMMPIYRIQNRCNGISGKLARYFFLHSNSFSLPAARARALAENGQWRHMAGGKQRKNGGKLVFTPLFLPCLLWRERETERERRIVL